MSKLTDEQEKMRMQVVDLELKARYWKAQFEIRHFTLEAEKIQPLYEEYLAAEKAKQEEMMKKFQEQLLATELLAEKGEVQIEEDVRG